MGRRLDFHRVLVWALGLSLLAAGCTSTAPGAYVLPSDDGETTKPGGAYRCQAPTNGEQLITELFERVQTERDRVGLPPLVLNETLCDIADAYSCAMIESRFFAHVSPDNRSSPGQRVTGAGYNFLAVGENLAAGQRAAADVIEQWMESPSHRANVLGNTWRETGIAVRSGGDYGVYWVQIFADPLEVPSRTEPSDLLYVSPSR